ncbi:MAG: ATP-dependent 6-phosphofructokinase [Pricia sp.]
MNPEKNFDIQSLGRAVISSPIGLSSTKGDKLTNFVDENEQVLCDVSLTAFERCIDENKRPNCLEKAGPRERIFFEPKSTTAAIVTCGGLCPGINNVIRSTVMALHYFYSVGKILGVPYGFEGLIPAYQHGFIELTPDKVRNINQFGGTILGSSRGAQSVPEMVDTLVKNDINILFAIGGDGTLKGAHAIAMEVEKRGIEMAVIGIPKTIDNDIDLIDKSFGFQTAFDVATPIIRDAHNEAAGAYNGVSIIKLMGRDSGFIAASAAISMPVVNFVLVPEMKFDLHGENGFLEALRKRLQLKQHAVIVVAEGAGQHLFQADGKAVTDASGNLQHQDIGLLLKNKIKEHFESVSERVTIKYIDPSYIIRSAPANANDALFCNILAYNAVHAGMAGKTDAVIGRVNHQFVHLPIAEVTGRRKKIDLEGELWFSALQSTGQPFSMEEM